MYILQQLGFTGTRITDKQDIDFASGITCQSSDFFLHAFNKRT